MALASTVRINGVDLDNRGRGWYLDKDTRSLPGSSTRGTPLEVSSRHGSILTGRLDTFPERSVTLSVTVVADDGSQATLRNRFDDLFGLLMSPELVYQVVEGSTVRESPARRVSIAEPEDFIAGHMLRVKAILALTDPFLRDVEYTTTGELSAGTHELTQLAGTAPIRDAVVRFTGPTTHVTVLDVVSGTQLEWIGSGVTSGRYLYLDPARMAAWHSASASAWDGSTGSVGASGGWTTPPPGRCSCGRTLVRSVG